MRNHSDRVRAYHGTPITSKDNVVLEAMGARDYFVSFYYPSQTEWIDANAREWAADCGEFSRWQAAKKAAEKAGVPFEGAPYSQEYLDRYIAWCRRWCLEGRCAWVVIPDPIGTSEDELDAMLKMWPEDLKPYGVPVWHSTEPLERAVRLLGEYGRLCIGACGPHEAIGSPAFIARMDEVWDAIFAVLGSGPHWVHIFRSLRLLEPKWDWPARSGDSTKIARNHWRWKKEFYDQDRQPMACPMTGVDMRIWAVKQEANRWDALAAKRPELWVPRHLRAQPSMFEGEAA